MSSSRFGGRGHAAHDLDEEKKLELDFLLAKKELETSSNSNLDGRIVTISGDALFTHEPAHISGQVVYSTNTGTGGWGHWVDDGTITGGRRFTVTSSGQSIGSINISGNIVTMQMGVYRRSHYIGESLPNIWCHICYAGLSESLHYGRIWTDRGKIWAECFNCWRKNHERD